MRALTLDYLRARGPLTVFARATALAAGLAVLGAAGYLSIQRWRELDGLRAQVDEVERMARRSGAALRTRPEETPETEAEVRRANAVLDQLNLPWLELFDAIETTRDGQVALLSIQPDARQRIVRIGAEAKSLAVALDYARRLAQHPRLAEVHFVSHEIVQQDAQKPVRVQLVAAWRPGS